MTAQDTKTSDIVESRIASKLHYMHTAIPAKVTTYDPLTNTCFAKPVVKTALRDDNGDIIYEDWPEIPFIPVCFPRAGDFVLTFPIAEGDYVLLVFSEASTAEWRDSGDFSEPWDLRRFSSGYPLAIPGAFPPASPLSSSPTDVAARGAGIVLGQHDGAARIEITSAFIKLGASATDFVALSSKVDAIFSALKTYASAVGTCFGTIPAPAVPTGLATYTAAQAAFEAQVQSVAAAMTKAK